MRNDLSPLLGRNAWRLGAALFCLFMLTCLACSPPAAEIGPHQFNVGFAIYDFTYTNPEGEEEVVTTAVWYPTKQEPSSYTYNNGLTSSVAFDAVPDEENGPYPLMIFNHGAYASGIESLHFTERLASEGFIVAAPDFIDTLPPDFTEQIAFNRIKGDEGVAQPRAVLEVVDDFVEMMNADREAFLSYLERFRLKKAGFVIDEMLELNQDSDSAFYNLIDEDAIGMSGHSLGGLTTLGVIGAHPDESMKDERIKAAILLSAPAYPFEDNIGQIHIPIMIMHGDHDLPVIRPEIQRGVVYDNANPPKFYLVIRRCTHFTFGNSPCEGYDSIPQCHSSDGRVQVINDYGSAFFKRYLKQDLEAEAQLQESDSMLVTYEREFR